MVSVQLNGVHKVRAGGRVYFYAWRGGPRLPGEPGSPEFVAAYAQAHKARKIPNAHTLKALITAFKASPEFEALSDHTTRAWQSSVGEMLKHGARRAKGARRG